MSEDTSLDVTAELDVDGADLEADADSPESVNIVHLLSPNLDGAQRRFLRAQAHALKPVVLVGSKGVTDALIEQVEAALLAHELIRVKVHDREALDEAATLIHNATSAQLAQRLGKTLLFFRAHPAEPKLQLPGAPKPKPKRAKVKKSTGSHGHKRKVSAPNKSARADKPKSAPKDAPRGPSGRRPRPGKKPKKSAR